VRGNYQEREREYHLDNCGGKGKARRRFIPKINGIISVKP
jgi:hypothetical protein